MLIGIIIGAVILILIIWAIASYNGFVRLRNTIEEAFSTMDVYLKKRYEAIAQIIRISITAPIIIPISII
jgi:LemA protein